ncbi:restriction endonuclease subunit S [Staphylococcus aureus]|uniref:restriction endonuclease subunit S n=1 Tax=Staphylococcus aureus TaxID=1280 RepID=UPI00208F87E1|nr:restriction endonuclease subunit S [Staphylococcus aureus]MCO4427795.1 hypothetical protein [Staphylococcus aureus]
MTEQTNTPVLRFKSFNDEWSLSTIGALGDFYYGKSAPKWSITEDVGIPCIRYGELYTKFNNVVNEIYSYTSMPKEKLRFSKGGEILIPRVGEDPLDFAKCVYLPQKDIAIGEMISVYNTKENPLFLTYYFNTKMKYEFAKRVEGASVSNLYYSYLEDIKLKIPDIREQEKLGQFFSKLDRQIELEEEKLELLEQQKRGYMQKIFSQELRFKDENGNEYPEWEDKKLLNVIAIQNGYAFKSNLFSEKGMPIIRITDINKSTVKKGTVYYPESIEINERFKIKQYDILIAMSGATTGKVGKYISEKPSLLNQRIGKFVMKKGTDNNFMFTYLNSLYFKKELSKLLVAGAQPNISSQDIENINLFIPINEEQRKIGEFFNELDELIEKQSSKIGVLKQRKKGFLQKMFV